MPRREVAYTGTNSQGNTYTTYTDGAYRYSNTTSYGAKTNYYNTGDSAFYTNRSIGYSTYTNNNTGATRTTWSK